MNAVRTVVSPARKVLINCSVMLSMLIVALDGTIANVALPHMQASLMASPEQVVWVLTSYLIASAIMTPLSSWLASRYGRKLVMTTSALIFTLASLACGLANSLPLMVVARLIQGLSGAGLIPLGQATLMDINPPEKQGQAMAMAALGAMLGPLSGPTLGGWLTDVASWRWVFLINIPFGLAAFAGLSLSLVEIREKNVGQFDFFGFATISLFLGAFQLMMDRGEQLNWFESREIWIEASVAGLFAWLALVHMATARNTFVSGALFANWNFTLGCIISAIVGLVIFATIPIITMMMQMQLGYSPLHAGIVSLPRGVGTAVGLFVVGRIMDRVDARLLVLIGTLCGAVGFFLSARISLAVDEVPLLIAGGFQGLAGGLMLPPLSALVYSKLEPNLRNQGAAIYSLARNMGNSLGISAMQSSVIHADAAAGQRLIEGIRPDNPVLQYASPDFDFDSLQALATMGHAVWRQAAMVAVTETMWLAFVITMASLPLVFLMRTNKPAT